MANTVLTSTKIVREALRILRNNLAFARTINTEYDKHFAQSGAKIGSSVKVRKPNRYTVRSGAAMSDQDTVEESVDIVMTSQKGVDINFTSEELTLHLDDFSKRILQPAMATLANQIDLEGLLLYKDIYNRVGTPGTTPATALALLDVNRRLDDEAAPRDGNRSQIVNPAANAALVNGLKSLFHNGPDISEQYKRGLMGANVLGFGEIAMDQNVAVHTVGAHGGTPLVAGGSQTGASLVTDGWTNSTLIFKDGDVFTLADVYAVNPQSRVSTGVLRQFVATADGTSDGSGNLTQAISPSIVTTGAKQNVDAGPADNAAITVFGTASTQYPINMGHHRDAFVLATADLIMPGGVDFASRDNSEGMAMRIIRQYTIADDKFPCRIDVLYGWSTVYPELACGLIG